MGAIIRDRTNDRNMRPGSRGLGLAGAAVLVAVAGPSFADGFDGERLAPAAGAAGGFVVERPVVPAHLGYGLGLILHGADDAVVERDNATGNTVARPLDSALGADLIGSLGLFDVAELALHLPVRLIYRGDPVTSNGAALQADAGVGDLRLVPKATLLRRGDENGGFVLGVAVPLSLPTGRAAALRGAGGVTAEPRLLAMGYGRRWLLTGSGGFRVREPQGAFAPGHEVTFGLAATYSLPVDGNWLDLQAEGLGGWLPGLHGRALVNLPLEALGGIIVRPALRWHLYVAAGAGLTNGLGVPDFRILAGVRYAVGVPTRGGQQDRDGDGIVDRQDRCPNEAEDFDGFQDGDGCPEPDNDGDGILDDDDECPDEAEERGGDGDGCPDRPRIVIRKGRVIIYGKVLFALGSAEISPRSERLLDDMAHLLHDPRPVRRLEIQGYTDSTGGAEFNQKLSQERAEHVKAALIKRGIDGRRLVARGYGEENPLAPNLTNAGRAKNRRVEFTILE
jgi:outer membrane protein OmpA-like peptidoglycan-associated protein